MTGATAAALSAPFNISVVTILPVMGVLKSVAATSMAAQLLEPQYSRQTWIH